MNDKQKAVKQILLFAGRNLDSSHEAALGFFEGAIEALIQAPSNMSPIQVLVHVANLGIVSLDYSVGRSHPDFLTAKFTAERARLRAFGDAIQGAGVLNQHCIGR